MRVEPAFRFVSSASWKGPLELWATVRLPFEPKGEVKRMRDELRGRLGELASDGSDVLHAVYASSASEFVDVENVLVYNVGAACLGAATRRGLRFERAFELPRSPELGFEPRHYYRYELASVDCGFASWEEGTRCASWSSVPVPPLSGSTKVADLWLRLRQSAQVSRPLDAGVPFSLRLEVSADGAPRPAAFVKPLFDAAICALHVYDGNADALAEASRRIAPVVGMTPQAVADVLRADAVAVLGKRRTVVPYREGVKWDPADDRCLAGEVLTTSACGAGWTVSGELRGARSKPRAASA